MIVSADYREKQFENDIVRGFELQGWKSAPNDLGYDRARALYVPDVLAWLKTAYKDKFEAFSKRADFENQLLNAIEGTLRTKGTLWLLRHEMTIIGFGSFKMCESQPEDGRNAAVAKRYQQNILRVVQQVHFRVDKQDSVDLVFFVNGIPVATAEVKTNFTQDVNEAVEEYKTKRKPKPNKNSVASPLLVAERGAVVHFAISESDIQMTTRLDGENTRFLPFNKGNDGHAGNPPPTDENPYPVSYFWKELGQKDAWIGLFHRFAFIDEKTVTNEFGLTTKKRTLIFPRYHQWRAVTRMIDDARNRGVGQKYLIEHSAGSGKTNTITWTAFQLSALRDADGNAYFDTILILSDRRVLDTQLSRAVKQFNTVEGLVQAITGKSGSKTDALVKALEDGKRIVVVTIQTFPFAMEQIIQNKHLAGKRFAVIFDEAHNSQTGRSSANLNAALGESGKGANEGETIDDLLERLQKSRKRPDNVSFFGFTATPKHQTFMLFGRKPNGDPFDLVADGKLSKQSKTGVVPVSFDKYPMRQAIEEGFIRDVLDGFVTYETCYKLTQKTKADQESVERVDGDTTRTGLARWKTLHPTNVSQKVQFIIEHFRRNVAGMLDGNAKAMIVTSSRAAVVRYSMAFRKYIEDHPEYNDIPILRLGVPLAAFSGEVAGSDAVHISDVVTDETTAWVNLIDPSKQYTEQNLNPPSISFSQEGTLEREFDKLEYRMMIVANKFQTGFDQPKLCAMYIDKVIGNPVEIVQTYSRVNRIYPGKDKTFIVDFVNKQEDVLKAFKMYDSGAVINEAQDPQFLEKLRQAILDVGLFNMENVEKFVQDYYAPQLVQFEETKELAEGTHENLNKLFGQVAQKFKIQLDQAFETCQDLELEHQSALRAGNEERAKAIDAQLLDSSKEYESLKRFKSNLGRFVSAYNYIAQVTDINEGSLEGLAAYCALLKKYLLGIKPVMADLSSVLLSHYELKPINAPKPEQDRTRVLAPMTGGGGNEVQGKLPEYLRDILDQVSNFAGDISDVKDAVNYCQSVADKVSENKVAVLQVRNNTREVAKAGIMGDEVRRAVFELLNQNKAFAAMVSKDPDKCNELMNIVYALINTSQRISPETIKQYSAQ